ncbi:type I-F CRISPR-associated protein Csy2 [Xylophilus sp. GW821-FHT01B05]
MTGTTAVLPHCGGLLVLPHLRIQNANAISSPMTHGFPAMSAFLGFAWALGRKLAAENIPLRPVGIGAICHAHQEQVNDAGYVRTFHLSRNPVGKDGSTAAIVEEGRIHLDITLVIGVNGSPSDNPLLREEAAQEALARRVGEIVASMRVAGGSVLPPVRGPGRRIRPELVRIAQDPEDAAKQFRALRRQWLPGFALVSRDDLLQQRLAQLRAQDPQAHALDAWLDLARFNWRPRPASGGAPPPDGKVEWQHDHDDGWIVPIPVGYGALSSLYPAGAVRHGRDQTTRMRFVESLYSTGQWIAPHRLTRLADLLWYANHQPDAGLYRCRNDYRPLVPVPQNAPTGHAADELLSFN